MDGCALAAPVLYRKTYIPVPSIVYCAYIDYFNSYKRLFFKLREQRKMAEIRLCLGSAHYHRYTISKKFATQDSLGPSSLLL